MTLRDHAYKLAEPGAAHARGGGASQGRIMRAFGDVPAEEITGDGRCARRRRQRLNDELRREPKPAPLISFSPEEIEAVARALAGGVHRRGGGREESTGDDRERQDAQDAEAVRLSVYTGLRRHELIARSAGKTSTGQAPS